MGDPKKQDYLLWFRLLCSTGFPCYVNVLGTHLYQCTNWHCYERLHLVSVNFFLRLFQLAQFIVGDLQAHLPTPHSVFNSCWPKMTWPQCPTLPIHTILPQDTFFVSLGKKSPQRETFCWYRRGETTNSRSTKRHQNQWIKKRSGQWKNILIGVLHQMESTLKVTEV